VKNNHNTWQQVSARYSFNSLIVDCADFSNTTGVSRMMLCWWYSSAWWWQEPSCCGFRSWCIHESILLANTAIMCCSLLSMAGFSWSGASLHAMRSLMDCLYGLEYFPRPLFIFCAWNLVGWDWKCCCRDLHLPSFCWVVFKLYHLYISAKHQTQNPKREYWNQAGRSSRKSWVFHWRRWADFCRFRFALDCLSSVLWMRSLITRDIYSALTRVSCDVYSSLSLSIYTFCDF